MENSRNASNCSASDDIGRYISRTKKASNLSLRLHPDFDIKKYIAQNLASSDPSGEILFYGTVQLLSPQCITDMLQRILNFLQSDSKELCFPNILSNKERFLVQIASDNKFLACLSFNIENQVLARKILHVVEENRNVFKRIHSYESGSVTKNLLVYRKMYSRDVQQKKTMEMSAGSRLNASLMSDSSIESSQSLRDLPKAQKEFITRQRLIQGLPAYFINSSLQAVASFMEDPLKASLEFTDISSKESRFLQCITSLARDKDLYQFFSQNHTYLLNSIAKLSCKRQDWKLEVFVGKLNKITRLRILTFRKVCWYEKRPEKQQIKRQSVPEKSVVPEDRKPRPIAKQNSVAEKGVEIQNVLKPTPNVTKVPVQRAMSKDRRNRPITGISFQSAANIEYMEEDKNLPKIQYARKNKLLDAMSTPMESDIAERMMAMMGWKGGALGPRADGIKEPIIPALHLSKGAGLGHVKAVTRSVSDFRRGFLQNLLLLLGSNEMEKVVPYNPALTRRERGFVGNSVSAFNSRKLLSMHLENELQQLINRIIEQMKSDLCLQIECLYSADKTEMKIGKTKTTCPIRTFPTKGGALGAQGDSITEPIKPPSRGARRVVPRSAPEFRRGFLQNLLLLLDSNEMETVVPYNPVLTKKERSFIGSSVNDFNCRRVIIGLRLEAEVHLMNRIMEKMISDSLQINSLFSVDLTKLKIIKIKTTCPMSTAQKTKKTKKKSTNSNTPSNNMETGLPNIIKEVIATYELETFCPSTKSAKTLAYKILFLNNIKEFLELPDLIKEYSIDCILTKKQTSYLQRVVLNINKKHGEKLSCEIEDDLFKEIRSVAGDSYMTVTFDENKFVLQKRIYQKRFTNSALLPPPVSIDHKKTIIYLNNVATSENRSVTSSENQADSGNDDVIMVEEKSEIIVISDSDSVNSQFMDTRNEKIDCDVQDIINTTLNTVYIRDEDMSESLAASIEAHSFNLLKVKGEMEAGNREDEDLDDSFNLEDEIIKLEDSLHLEVNNNINFVKNLNGTDVFDNKVSVKDLTHSSGKRSRSQSSDYEPFFKVRKCDEVINVSIAPYNYPKENISLLTVQKFQLMVSDFIEESTILPLLECHGVQDGALKYSCHSEKTLLWLTTITSNSNLNLKIEKTHSCKEKKYVVKFKINSYIQDDVKTIIDRLELYNTGLDTRDWKLIKEKNNLDATVITVEIDEESLMFISEHFFSMFLGVDKAQFSIVFD